MVYSSHLSTCTHLTSKNLRGRGRERKRQREIEKLPSQYNLYIKLMYRSSFRQSSQSCHSHSIHRKHQCSRYSGNFGNIQTRSNSSDYLQMISTTGPVGSLRVLPNTLGVCSSSSTRNSTSTPHAAIITSSYAHFCSCTMRMRNATVSIDCVSQVLYADKLCGVGLGS